LRNIPNLYHEDWNFLGAGNEMHRVTEWVRTHRTLPITELMAALNQKLVGYYHYPTFRTLQNVRKCK